MDTPLVSLSLKRMHVSFHTKTLTCYRLGKTHNRVYCPYMKTKTMQLDITTEPLISQAKAAELCGMTRAAMLDLVRRGCFHSVMAEGRNLVYYKEVEAFAAGK